MDKQYYCISIKGNGEDVIITIGLVEDFYNKGEKCT